MEVWLPHHKVDLGELGKVERRAADTTKGMMPLLCEERLRWLDSSLRTDQRGRTEVYRGTR